jgi:hypothetical protein
MARSSKSSSRRSRRAEAWALYKKTLAQIQRDLGKTTTDENQLKSVGARLFGDAFRGVFASDTVPRPSASQPYCVVNTDREGSAGTHWLALAGYPPTRGKIFLYDSFGRPTSALVPWIRGAGNVVDSELDAEQVASETNCGQRCLAWLVVFDELGPDAALTI